MKYTNNIVKHQTNIFLTLTRIQSPSDRLWEERKPIDITIPFIYINLPRLFIEDLGITKDLNFTLIGLKFLFHIISWHAITVVILETSRFNYFWNLIFYCYNSLNEQNTVCTESWWVFVVVQGLKPLRYLINIWKKSVKTVEALGEEITEQTNCRHHRK